MRDRAVAIVRRLVEHGHEAYFCGGSVRDQVMGLTPKDFDLATSARPEVVRALFDRTHPVGEAFGVVLVVVGGKPFEVATFRTEGAYTDGRRPLRVTFSGARQDVARRDFTINGLLYDPLTDRVIDHVGGTDDIGRAIVRTIGDPRRRFAEDHLRLLRAIRFAVRLGFEIDPETWEAIRSQAARIGRIARERIGAEILSIVGSPDPARGVELLHRSGLLAHVLPELADRTPEGNGSNPGAGPTLSVLRSLEDPTPEVALAALVHDLGADEEGVSGTIGRRLALSRRSVRAVEDLLRLRPAFDRGAEQSLADLKGLLARDDIEDHLAFHRARLVGSGQGTETLDLYREWLARAALDRDCIDPPRLIDGRDLLSLGFGSGPEIGRTLEAIRRDQLDEAIGTREEALARARQRLEPGFIPEAT